MSLWSNILFNCAVLINLIVAFFYPFMDNVPSTYHSDGGSQNVALYFVRNFQFLTCFRQAQECARVLAGRGYEVSFVCLYVTSVTCKCLNAVPINFDFLTRRLGFHPWMVLVYLQVLTSTGHSYIQKYEDLKRKIHNCTAGIYFNKKKSLRKPNPKLCKDKNTTYFPQHPSLHNKKLLARWCTGCIFWPVLVGRNVFSIYIVLVSYCKSKGAM